MKRSETDELHPFFSKQKKPKLSTNWTQEDGLLIGKFNFESLNTNKIAAFDLDWTIAKTKGKHIFHKDKDDWEFFLAQVPNVLASLFKTNHQIVLFSNQTSLGKDNEKMNVFKTRVDNIFNALNLPIILLASTASFGIYRKPSIGMWNYFKSIHKLEIDLQKSFYVGDAAGRPQRGSIKKDFSSSDRKFALNLSLPFYTPEEYFLKCEKQHHDPPTFNPKTYKSTLPLFTPTNTPLVSKKLEVIIFVGFPGSGKSNFAKKYFPTYQIINQDTLGTRQKCLNEMSTTLNLKKSCIIDNTNPSIQVRQEYIAKAAKSGVFLVRCFYFTADEELSKHNNLVRTLFEGRERVPDIVYNMFKKGFQEPSLEEGFDEVKRIGFLEFFESDEKEKEWRMFYI